MDVRMQPHGVGKRWKIEWEILICDVRFGFEFIYNAIKYLFVAMTFALHEYALKIKL